MKTITAAIIVAYLAIVTLIIVYTGRKVKTFKDYALADAKLPWFVISGTILATSIGGGSMMGYVGSFYLYGPSYFWIVLASLVSLLILTFFLSKRIRRLNIYTIADIFEARYGKGAQLVAGFINMFVGMAVGFAMLSSFSTLLSEYVGFSMTASRIIGVILFAVTATMGGFAGVAITDAIQAVFIIGGAITVAVVAFTKAGGVSGLSQLSGDFLSMTNPHMPPMIFLGLVFSSFCTNLADQATMFQRINAARSPKDSQRALFSSSILVTVCMGLVLIMGLSARVILGEGLEENVVITRLLQYVHPAIATLYSAAIIAAILTTANSMYLSASMTFSRDLVKQFVPDLSDKKMVLISRLFVWVTAIASYFVITYQPSIMKWIMIGYASITCQILPLYGGLLTKKATPASGKWSLALSIAGVLIWEALGSPFDINSVFIAVALGLVGFFVGFAFKKGVTDEQKALVDKFTAKVSEETEAEA